MIAPKLYGHSTTNRTGLKAVRTRTNRLFSLSSPSPSAFFSVVTSWFLSQHRLPSVDGWQSTRVYEKFGVGCDRSGLCVMFTWCFWGTFRVACVRTLLQILSEFRSPLNDPRVVRSAVNTLASVAEISPSLTLHVFKADLKIWPVSCFSIIKYLHEGSRLTFSDFGKSVCGYWPRGGSLLVIVPVRGRRNYYCNTF